MRSLAFKACFQEPGATRRILVGRNRRALGQGSTTRSTLINRHYNIQREGGWHIVWPVPSRGSEGQGLPCGGPWSGSPSCSPTSLRARSTSPPRSLRCRKQGPSKNQASKVPTSLLQSRFTQGTPSGEMAQSERTRRGGRGSDHRQARELCAASRPICTPYSAYEQVRMRERRGATR